MTTDKTSLAGWAKIKARDTVNLDGGSPTKESIEAAIIEGMEKGIDAFEKSVRRHLCSSCGLTPAEERGVESHNKIMRNRADALKKELRGNLP